MKACLFAVVLSSTLAVASPSKDIDVAVGDVPKDFTVRELEKDFVTRAEMVVMRMRKHDRFDRIVLEQTEVRQRRLAIELRVQTAVEHKPAITDFERIAIGANFDRPRQIGKRDRRHSVGAK